MSLANISISSLLAGLIFGIIGMFVLRDGRKKGNPKLAVVGVLLMAYPYFTPGFWLIDWVIGITLCYTAYTIQL